MVLTTELTPEQRKARERKVLENKLRRWAKRQGFRLEKSKRRDKRALDYGTYKLIRLENNAIEVGGDNGTTIDMIKAALEGAS